MFTRAGIDLRRARVILIYARMAIAGGSRVGWATLLRFRSGDLAWYCKSPEFICWGLRAQIINRVRMPWHLHTWNLPHSDIETRKECNWPAKEGQPFFEKPPKPVKVRKLPASATWSQPDLLGEFR